MKSFGLLRIAALLLVGVFLPQCNAFVERWVTNFDGFLPKTGEQASRTVYARVRRCAFPDYFFSKRRTRRCFQSRLKKFVEKGKMTEEDVAAIVKGISNLVFNEQVQSCRFESELYMSSCAVRAIADMVAQVSDFELADAYALIDYMFRTSLYDCASIPGTVEGSCVVDKLQPLVQRKVIVPNDQRYFLITALNLACPKQSAASGSCAGFPDQFSCQYGHVYFPKAKGRDRKCTGGTTCYPTTVCNCGANEMWSCRTVRLGSCNGDAPENTFQSCDL